jgi:hypothetical protein
MHHAFVQKGDLLMMRSNSFHARSRTIPFLEKENYAPLPVSGDRVWTWYLPHLSR